MRTIALVLLLAGCSTTNLLPQPASLQNHGFMMYDLIQDGMKPQPVLKPGELEI